MDQFDVIVIGGGPAGMITAGRCAEAGLKVMLIEKMHRPGRKLGITGKGRCKLTNTAAVEDYSEKIQPDGRFMRSSFSMFFNSELISFMNSLGVETETERGGRVFPKDGKATDIVRRLESWLRENRVKLLCNTRADKLLLSGNRLSGVEVTDSISGKKHRYFSESVVLATGGLSYPATGSTGDGYRLAASLGHTLNKTYPSLVPLESRFKHLPLLKGLKLKNVKASVYINNQLSDEAFGEINFIDKSISGPIILNLSRTLVKKIIPQNRIYLSIDLKPALDKQKLDARLLRDIDKYGSLELKNLLRKLLPGQLVRICINKLGLNQNKAASQLSSDERSGIIEWLKDFRLDISGYRPYSEAIITSGGIEVSEVDQKTFRSKIADGLYLAGEVLDLDGPTGGYNLQIAFTTGWCAAEGIKKDRWPEPRS